MGQEMITRGTILQAKPEEIPTIYSNLTVEKMKLDKWFSDFLDQNELSDTDYNTVEWKTYRSMLLEYEKLNSLLITAIYYMNNPNGKH